MAVSPKPMASKKEVKDVRIEPERTQTPSTSQPHHHGCGPSCQDHDEHEKWAPIPSQVRRSSKIGRNEACPCGSGKKYKKCCLTP